MMLYLLHVIWPAPKYFHLELNRWLSVSLLSESYLASNTSRMEEWFHGSVRFISDLETQRNRHDTSLPLP
jgi:hypothetical protein